MSEDVARRKLLSMIENGDITAEEGLRLLNTFDNASDENQDVSLISDKNNPAFTVSDQDQPDDEGEVEIQHLNSTSDDARRIRRLKKWWFLPFGIGLILTVVSAIWINPDSCECHMDVPWLCLKGTWLGILAILVPLYPGNRHHGIVSHVQQRKMAACAGE